MAKIKSTDAKLLPWQQSVVQQIEKHPEIRDSEAYQGVPEFKINRDLGITVSLPRGSGHSYLANYLAARYPSMLLYHKMDDYKQVTQYFDLHPASETVSVYEIFWALYKPSSHQPSPELADIGKRLKAAHVIVIDNSLSVSEDVKNFVYDTASGIIVMLGH